MQTKKTKETEEAESYVRLYNNKEMAEGRHEKIEDSRVRFESLCVLCAEANAE